MRIKVRYQDNTYGMVDESRLQDLIASDDISAFLRSSGWAVIGRDQVRSQRHERRRAGQLINVYV